MITYKRPTKASRDYIQSVFATESKEAREVVERDVNLYREDLLKVASFLEMLYDGDIIIWDRTTHVIFNGNGTIYIADVYPEVAPAVAIYCAWNPLTHKLVFEMNPIGRKLLGRCFNYKN